MDSARLAKQRVYNADKRKIEPIGQRQNRLLKLRKFVAQKRKNKSVVQGGKEHSINELIDEFHNSKGPLFYMRMLLRFVV